ncbi:MAG: RNA polymerase sporulation sigma factor SigH [Candidatus Woesearchaeota archaeon]
MEGNIYNFKHDHPDDYQQFSDNELIKKAHNGDRQAEEILIERYKIMVYFKSKSYFIAGGDKKDIVQEGMIGLYKAIRDYEIGHKTSFSSFAGICIIRQMITAIKTANRKKRQPLNKSISLNKPIYNEESNRTLLDIFKSDNLEDPENLFLSKDKFDLIQSGIKDISTDLELSVIKEYLKGKSYKKIAETLDIHTKSVDNALQRIKKKLKTFLKNHNISAEF